MKEKKQAQPMSFRERAEALARRRWVIIVPLAVSVFVAVIVSLFMPPVYEASSTIQVMDKKIIDPLVKGLAVAPGTKEQVDVLTKQIQSWPQMMRLVDRFDLARDLKSDAELEDLINKLRKRITIESKGGDLISIKLEYGDPVMAQKIVNAVTQDFIEENARSRREEARSAIEFIGEQLKIYRNKLEESEKNFSSHKIEADLRVAQNRQRLLEDSLAKLQKVVPSHVKTQYSPVFSKLQAHLAELEIEKARLMMDATSEHPRVKELNREISDIKTKLDEEMKKDMVRESITTINPAYFQMEQELKQVEMEISYLAKRKQELESRGVNPEKQLSEEQLSTLETAKQVDEDIYEMLLKQMEAAYVSERLSETDNGARLGVIEYARLPARPMSPIRMRIVFMGLFFGVMLGAGGVVAMEHMDRSFRTVDDVKHTLELPVMGSISKIMVEQGKPSVVARFKEGMMKQIEKYSVLSEMRFVTPHTARKSPSSSLAPQVVIFHEPKANVSEEYRILRTNLLGMAADRELRIVTLTSSVRGEGKSTTSANLAVSIADAGRKTLLIDCDLRRGSVHETFHLPQGPGLTHLIAGTVGLETAVMKTEVKNLSIITGGTKPTKPSELLGSQKMGELLKKFSASYDTIILDAPPVLNLPDAPILAKYSDAVVFIIQAERTQREEVIRAQSMLKQSRANVTGFVLTNVRYYIPKYLYDYYYGKY